jgi:hypothetical protein
MTRRRRGHETIYPDNLDGCCDLETDNGPPVSDEEAPFVVLFARQLGPDLELADKIGAHVKAAEWRNLFGGGR